jgi:hypothetical protein
MEEFWREERRGLKGKHQNRKTIMLFGSKENERI